MEGRKRKREKKKNKHKEHDTNGTGYLLSFVCVVLDQINPQKRKKQKKVHGKMVNDASYESRLDRILKQHKSNSSFLSSCIWQRRRKERKEKRKTRVYHCSEIRVSSPRSATPTKITLKNNQKKSRQKRIIRMKSKHIWKDCSSRCSCSAHPGHAPGVALQPETFPPQM